MTTSYSVIDTHRDGTRWISEFERYEDAKAHFDKHRKIRCSQRINIVLREHTKKKKK